MPSQSWFLICCSLMHFTIITQGDWAKSCLWMLHLYSSQFGSLRSPCWNHMLHWYVTFLDEYYVLSGLKICSRCITAFCCWTTENIIPLVNIVFGDADGQNIEPTTELISASLHLKMFTWSCLRMHWHISSKLPIIFTHITIVLTILGTQFKINYIIFRLSLEFGLSIILCNALVLKILVLMLFMCWYDQQTLSFSPFAKNLMKCIACAYLM